MNYKYTVLIDGININSAKVVNVRTIDGHCQIELSDNSVIETGWNKVVVFKEKVDINVG